MARVVGEYELLDIVESDELSTIHQARHVATGELCALELLDGLLDREIVGQGEVVRAHDAAGGAAVVPHQAGDLVGVLLVEDDPYGDLRFTGEDLPPISSFMEGGYILLGTLSKIAAPGLRMGWMACDEKLFDNFLVAKQAADLHTSTLTQQLALHYLSADNIDEHIEALREAYGRQKDCMVRMISKYFPGEAAFTEPQGGMFLWVTLPEGCSTVELFEKAVEKKVAFVPGVPFYTDGGGINAMRLNFSNAAEPQIEEGIRRLGQCLDEYLKESTI